MSKFYWKATFYQFIAWSVVFSGGNKWMFSAEGESETEHAASCLVWRIELREHSLLAALEENLQDLECKQGDRWDAVGLILETINAVLNMLVRYQNIR